MPADDNKLVPDFDLLVDGTKADPELRGAVIGIRVATEMGRASRFSVQLSDQGRKYTKDTKFKVGTSIEIKLGYAGALTTVAKGEIATWDVAFNPDGPTRLVVSGFDKSINFSRGTATKTYKDVKDSDLATQIANKLGLSPDVEDSKVVHDFVIQNNMTDYDFLMQRAAIAGYLFMVADKKLVFKKPAVGQAAAATLTWRENIQRFLQEVNTYDQVSKITTTGWDPKTQKQNKSSGKGGDELGKMGGQTTGADLVKKMFGEVETSMPIASGQANLLENVAKAEFNKRGGTFVNAEARVTG